MRALLLFLTGLIALASSAQNLTQAQKQEALQCATKFCELLTRFSNGERTLNTQINALCSGADCSAFDDIKTNKEITLRNYLLAIQTKYPHKLPMAITTPTLSDSKVYAEPVMGMSLEWGKIDDSAGEAATGTMLGLSVDQISNYYVVFNVRQDYTSLGRSVNKKLIYDVANQKITAFITDNGSYICFLNSLSAFSKKDYKNAIYWADMGSKNSRSSLTKKCHAVALLSATYSGDFAQGIKYAELYGDRLYIAFLNAIQLMLSENFSQMPPYVRELESLLETRTDMGNIAKGNLYCSLGNIFASPLYPGQNMDKALAYMKKAIQLDCPNAGYLIYIYYTLFGENFASADIALTALEISVNLGYPPSFYPYAVLLEGNDYIDDAKTYYEKSAKSGNYIAMACLGRLLINQGDKANGVNWLKKALSCDNLDEKIELEGTGWWPKSRADVQALLNKYNNSTTSSYSSSPSYSSHSASTSSSTSSSSGSSYSSASSYTPSSSYHTSSSSSSGSYSSYSSYNSYSSHRFNEAKDDFCMGLSAGYVRKEWLYNDGSSKENLDVFWEDKYTNGIQVGLRVDCQFGYGFGLNSGLFYEYYFDKSEDFVDNDITFYYRMKEHSLYLPVHFKYNLNFSRWFQIGLYGGIGLDCGLSGKYILCSPEELYSGDEMFSPGDTLDSFSMYSDEYDLKRFNASLEYGASIRIRRLQLNFTISKGLVNMSGSHEYTVKQNKVMSLTASLCF